MTPQEWDWDGEQPPDDRALPDADTAIAVVVTSVSKLLVSRQCQLMGWAFRETAGAAAAARLHNGSSANGQYLAILSFPASGESVSTTSGRGIAASSGIYLEVVQGTIEGVVWVRYKPSN